MPISRQVIGKRILSPLCLFNGSWPSEEVIEVVEGVFTDASSDGTVEISTKRDGTVTADAAAFLIVLDEEADDASPPHSGRLRSGSRD